MSLVPLPPDEKLDFDDEIGSAVQEKPASFAKTLTQSDANNGGGFSVPRYCAETIFPRLDYAADPPVQTVVAKDVNGEVWKFRHIYRGTPRRHLLTTGWSTFVNQKKLVAGDSIVFLRAENGDLCVSIRRVKRGIGGGSGPGWSSSSFPQSGWGINANTCGATGMANPYNNFLVFLEEDESKAARNKSCGGKGSAAATKVTAEEVLEAVRLAASGRPFDVYYYPRASTPEFCVTASSARAAMRIHWCPGTRFKMPFETEDSSRISWFMATVASVQVADLFAGRIRHGAFSRFLPNTGHGGEWLRVLEIRHLREEPSLDGGRRGGGRIGGRAGKRRRLFDVEGGDRRRSSSRSLGADRRAGQFNFINFK
ncbi:unnamed protein product [Linum tenue]|nr:unnamed protein product [Linum tenue]